MHNALAIQDDHDHDHDLEPAPSTKRSSGVFPRVVVSPKLSFWDVQDEELRLAQVERSSRRLVRAMPSRFDATARAISRARGSLAVVVGRTIAPEIAPLVRSHRVITAALTSAYQFCLEMACELLAIESMKLTEEGERIETAAFLRFAIKSFDVVTERFAVLHELEKATTNEDLGALLWDMGSIRSAIACVITAYTAAC